MHAFELNNSLVCPICKEALAFAGTSLVCHGERRHNFDIAKSGYVNLNTHSSNSGDDKDMAKARQAFLRKGYYQKLADAIATEAGCGEILCDAGCGEGYYTEEAAKGFKSVLGADLSKHALTLASKSAKQNGMAEKLLYTVASVYSIPLADNSCDAVINVFAPCVEKEYCRILKNGGKLIVAAAGRNHLHGLKSVLYDKVIPNETRQDYPDNMKLEKCFSVTYDAKIEGEDIYSLFTMTPYFYKTSKESVEKLKSLDTLDTRLDFEVRVYIKEDK